MIRSFRHRGLKELYERGQSSKVAPEHLAKLLRIVTALDRSTNPEAMDLPGYRVHRLRGHHAVAVSANWQVTFRFDDGDVVDVDYVD